MAEGAGEMEGEAPGRPSTQGGTPALSETERAVGWEMLFDGSTLEGWRGYQREDAPGGWMAEDGTLRFQPGVEGGDLLTADRFGNFELALEWRLEPGGNSGIMFRVIEEEDESYKSGTEMQVLDNAGHPDGANPLTSAGANYGLYAPVTDASKPAGEWNAVRILANGPHVVFWLNDVQVVEFDLWSDDWKRRVAGSKFVEWPGYGLADTGHIALQDHGDPVWYRNVRIRRIGGD